MPVTTPTPVPVPTITTQPVDQALSSGQPLTLSVTASGGTGLSYQWNKDGVAIPGATSSTYTIASVSSGDAGSYSVTIKLAGGGFVTSRVTKVDVTKSASDLHSIFYRTIPKAPPVTFQFADTSGSGMPSGMQMIIDMQQWGAVHQRVGEYFTQSDLGTSFMMALPVSDQAYPLSLENSNVSQPLPNGAYLGGYRGSYLAKTQGYVNLATSLQTWTVITAGLNLTAFEADIYQCDAQGNINWGTVDLPANPLVLHIPAQAVGPTDKSVTFKTELFSGYYRVAIIPTVKDGMPLLPSYLTPASAPLQFKGDGLKTETVTINFPANKNNLLLTLQTLSGATQIPAAEGAYTVEIFDRAAGASLGSAINDAKGQVYLAVGDETDVVATLRDQGGELVGLREVKNIGTTTTLTWSQSLVSGQAVAPSGGTAVDYTSAAVQYRFNEVLGGRFDQFMYGLDSSVSSDGSFSHKAFDGKYQAVFYFASYHGATNAEPVSIQSPLSNAIQIPLSSGGTISGKVTDVGGAAIRNVVVRAIPRDSAPIPPSSVNTDASGNYTIHVPLGTYDLEIGGYDSLGAIVSGLTTTQDKPDVTQNITRFVVTGRLLDEQGNPVAATLSAGNQRNQAVTDAQGNFSLKLFLGANWVLMSPTTSSLNLSEVLVQPVQIDETTIKSN